MRYWNEIIPPAPSQVTVAMLKVEVQKQIQASESTTQISRSLQESSSQSISSQIDSYVLNLVRYIKNDNEERALAQYHQALLAYEQMLNHDLSKEPSQNFQDLLAHTSNLLAWSAHLLDSPAEGLNRARWAVQHDAEKPEYLHTLAVILCETDQREEAKIKLQEAAKQNRPVFKRLLEDALQTFRDNRCDIPDPSA